MNIADRQLAPDTVRELSRRRDGPGLARLAGHLAIVLGLMAATASTLGTAWYWPMALACGAVQVFLFAPLHECIHRTAFRSAWLNEVVAALCGLVLILPPRYFRAFHLAHHRYTQDPHRDPELIAPPPRTAGVYLWRASGVPYWVERAGTTARVAAGVVNEPFVRASERAALIVEARLYLLAYLALAAGSVAVGSAGVLWCVVVPMLLGQPLLRLYLMAEHGLCPAVPDMRLNTRTTRSNAVVRYFAWNMPYHAEHHLMASAPFHALPALGSLVGGLVANRSTGYLAFHREWWRARFRPGVLTRSR